MKPITKKLETTFYYEIWIRGKNGYSSFFSTNEDLFDIEDDICEFAKKHNLVENDDVKYFLGYANDCSDDKQKVEFCKENFIKA